MTVGGSFLAAPSLRPRSWPRLATATSARSAVSVMPTTSRRRPDANAARVPPSSFLAGGWSLVGILFGIDDYTSTEIASRSHWSRTISASPRSSPSA